MYVGFGSVGSGTRCNERRKRGYGEGGACKEEAAEQGLLVL
jgi:hypothetical protein